MPTPPGPPTGCCSSSPRTPNAPFARRRRTPEAWVRSGPQNVPLTQENRDRLKQRKRVVDFERSYCCDYHPQDVDQAVLGQFLCVFLPDDVRDFSDEELLYAAGALIRTNSGFAFTNAGLLFFAANPHAYSRARQSGCYASRRTWQT